jgi:hypothetical protein
VMRLARVVAALSLMSGAAVAPGVAQTIRGTLARTADSIGTVDARPSRPRGQTC